MTPGAVVAAIVAVLASRRAYKPVVIAGALTLATAGALCTLSCPRNPTSSASGCRWGP